MPDGTVVALTRSRAEAHHVADDPRFVATYTLSDVADLIEKHGLYFARPRKHDGEKVTPQAREIDDPLDPQGVSEMFLEDEIPFLKEETMTIFERNFVGRPRRRGTARLAALPSAAALRPSSSKAAPAPVKMLTIATKSLAAEDGSAEPSSP